MLMTILLACQSESTDAATTTHWYGEVEPIVAENCAGCHTEGGSAPFALDELATTAGMAEAALAAIESGSMPPWQPDDACREYKNPRGLSDDEIATFRQWVEEGTPEGDASLGTTPIPEVATLDATHTFTVPPYVSSAVDADDYRCFLIDVGNAEELYLTGSQVVPGSAQVHHVLVYAVESDMRDPLQAADLDEDGDGYTCYGSPYPPSDDFSGAGLPLQLTAWVPGIEPVVRTDGTAIRMPADGMIIAQVHYSIVGGEPEADSTRIELQLTDAEPEQLISTRPLLLQQLDIPAGESNVTFSTTFTSYRDTPLSIQGATAHMHTLGQQISTTLLHDDGTEECLLDIPDWDFEWQQAYAFLDDEWATLDPGEQLTLTCTYDNSAENQPIVDGEQIEPVDVTWGEGTLDEMCLMYISTVEPFTPPPDESTLPCADAADCLADCGDDPSVDCLLSCPDVGSDCDICTISAGIECAVSDCAAPFIAAQECLVGCMTNTILLDGSTGDCMSTECAAEYEAMLECVDPLMFGEACESQMADCGVE